MMVVETVVAFSPEKQAVMETVTITNKSIIGKQQKATT